MLPKNHSANGDFFTKNSLFRPGFFGPRNPLFQEMGIRGPVWGRENPKARSKISIRNRSLETFNPEGRDQCFPIRGPCGLQCHSELGIVPQAWRIALNDTNKEGKSAINLGNLGNFAKFGPGSFIYVRPVGGPENYLC